MVMIPPKNVSDFLAACLDGILAWRGTLRLVGWGCVFVLALLSLLPAEEMTRTGFPGRVEHVVAYTGTALVFGLAYGTAGSTRRIMMLAAYACILEYLQNFSPGRSAAWGDAVGSVSGVIAGTLIMYPLANFLARHRRGLLAKS